MKALLHKHRLLGLMLVFIVFTIILMQFYYAQAMLREDTKVFIELSLSDRENNDSSMASVDVVLRHYKQMMITFAVLIAALFLLLGILMWLQQKHFVTPLFELENSINAIKLEQDLTYRIPVGPAGFDTLAFTINNMLDRIEAYFNKLLEKEKNITRLNAELTESYSQLEQTNLELSAVEEELSQQLTELQRMDDQLRISEERWKFALEGSGAGVWDINFATKEINYSSSYKEMLGYSADDQIDEFNKLYTLIHPDDAAWVKNEVERHIKKEIPYYATEHRVRCKDGSYKWILDRGKVMVWSHDGKPLRMVGTHTDINERKKAEAEILYLSYHDKLTGLYNRAYFEAELKRMDQRDQLPLSIIMGDLNGLKMVNDVFGHEVGDKLLMTMAEIFIEISGRSGTVARIGGDEFAVILPETDADTANKIVNRIKGACSLAATEIIQPSISLGVGIKERAEQDVDTLYKQAENMMYNNKLVENKSIRSAIISSLRKTLEEKTHETEAHGQRLRNHALAIGEVLELHDNQLNELELLALLHDIGKIAIPDSILEKKGKLTEEEWVIMKKHCEIGYRIAVSTSELAVVADGILHHHERWDGKGYPQGLKEKEIPLASRIITIVDAYDAMTSDRPYHRAVSQDEAVQELIRCAGTQFDSEIVDVFIEKVLLL